MRRIVTTCIAACLFAGCAQDPHQAPIDQSRVETFDIPGDPPGNIDVLVVLDDTPDIAPYLPRIDAMLRALDHWPHGRPRNPNLHLAIATADPADAGHVRVAQAVHGPFVTDQMLPDWSRGTNYDSSLADALSQLGTTGTSGTASAPLAAIRAAIEQTPGFLRSDAYLAVLIVSAHDDASSEDPAAVAQWVQSLKPERFAFIVGAVMPANAPRLSAFVAPFQNVGITQSLDAADYTSVAQLIDVADKTSLAALCIDEPLDVDPSPGLQFDCSIEIVQSNGVVRAADTWTYELDPLNCIQQPGGRIAIGAVDFPFPSRVRGQCLVAK